MISNVVSEFVVMISNVISVISESIVMISYRTIYDKGLVKEIDCLAWNE